MNALILYTLSILCNTLSLATIPITSNILYNTAMITAKNLRAIRAIRGYSQADLANLAGVSVPSIAEFETGRRDIRASTIAKLCRALGVQVTYKIDDTEITGP